MTVRLKDIAEYLNISVSTVSRVINNKDRVDDMTREKVLKALKQFEYHPNEIARSLKSKNTKAIGVIVPDISNNYFAMVIKGIEAVIRQHGYYVIICNSDADLEKEEEYTNLLYKRSISGLIIAIGGRKADFLDLYKKSNIPVVFIENLPRVEGNYDYVTVDNVKAIRELTNHLINIGHRKLAMITGPLKESVSEERLAGWKKALVEHNISIKKRWIGIGDFTKESGYKIMQGFLKHEEVPTAIIAANNFLGYGAMHAIMDAGLKIPDDIALVCFDAIDFVGLIKPQLTSIIQPAEDIGKIAGEIIMRKIQHFGTKVVEKIILEPKLEIKESCGYINSISSKR